ncbi:tyrosine-type recombinase/integrase [Pseudomonas aeruginosa]|uniref:tyrosine-type recombinase/integrase n=1 Tax=Pseudomonas aeruginosa TaxID=287 RepID=UPI000F543F84|nr:tyrosine-type recombinase/integrase [Pseudomonas aeruginosa]RQB27301.1 integrase [Pseudomonas aeruginosa]
MPKLTKSYIDALQAPADKEAFHWDERDKGFGLRITPTGKITYVAQGRIGGKTVRLSIGPHGRWTPDKARDEARELLRQMDKGIDPRAIAKKEAAQRVTLRDVADAYKRDRPLKDSSKAEIERHVTTTFEAWLKKPLKDITREMVTKRFNEVKTKGTRGDGPAPAQANQSMAVLRALFNYAIREYREPDGAPVLTDNPVDVLYKKWVPLKPRTSRVPDNKVGAVWSYLTKAREQAYNRDTLASLDLVMLLLLTGLRIGECSELTWDRVNLDEGWIHIPDPKNSNPVWLPLSSQALELLKTRQRVKGSPFVFSSWGKCGHIRDPRDTMTKVSAAAGTKITPHDLRRTFTTIGIANCGIDLTRVELLTNHVPKGVTARHYLETSHLQYLKPETQRISDWIEQQAAALNDCSES